ncbi:MAG: carboxypeptidase regulatory-like domain-containing protein [Acidobacteria bacterium]|nr:carboxypeptidase regulatory-like domain-containing protein [Acidobacteriota bacterium]
MTKTLRFAGGIFEIDNLLPGQTVLVARGEQMAPTALRIALAAGELRAGLILRLKRAGTVRGSITDANGSPVRGARVRLAYTRADDSNVFLGGFIGGRLITRSDGVFVARNVIPGVPVLVLVDSDRGHAERTLVLSAGQAQALSVVLP